MTVAVRPPSQAPRHEPVGELNPHGDLPVTVFTLPDGRNAFEMPDGSTVVIHPAEDGGGLEYL